MAQIPTEKFKPELGTMNACIFENPSAGLEPTLFYDITIPLEPFDSGLSYESQPVKTSFRFNSIKFPVTDWRKFHGRSFQIEPDDADGSIYIGTIHNPVDIDLISFTRTGDFSFQIHCLLLCDFEFEMVAGSARVELDADVEFTGMEVTLKDTRHTPEDILKANEIASSQGKREAGKYLKEAARACRKARALEVASQLVELECYAEPESEEGRVVFKPHIKLRQ